MMALTFIKLLTLCLLVGGWGMGMAMMGRPLREREEN